MSEKEIVTMITREELQTIQHFNVDLLEEAIRQAELKLTDESKRKERIDTRAYTLLSVNIGVLTLLSGVVAILGVTSMLNGLFILISCCIFLSAICFLLRTLKSKGYGGLGVEPNIWLKKEFLKQETDSKGYVLANILYDLEGIISSSDEANHQRVELLDRAITTSVTAILALVIFLVLNAISAIAPNLFHSINFWPW
jgi:hypothetical protein